MRRENFYTLTKHLFSSSVKFFSTHPVPKDILVQGVPKIVLVQGLPKVVLIQGTPRVGVLAKNYFATSDGETLRDEYLSHKELKTGFIILVA